MGKAEKQARAKYGKELVALVDWIIWSQRPDIWPRSDKNEVADAIQKHTANSMSCYRCNRKFKPREKIVFIARQPCHYNECPKRKKKHRE
jgi:hypothetical protein